MAITSLKTAVKNEKDLLTYLKSELLAGRWLSQSPGAFFALTDAGFGSSSSSQAIADAHRQFSVMTSDTNTVAVDNASAANVNLRLDVPEALWPAALAAELAADREPFYTWIDFSSGGQRFYSGVFYKIT